MLFTQGVFWLLFAATFVALRVNAATLASVRVQNLVLLVASYVFYGWWDWRFLGLVAFSTVLDYAVALRIAAASDPDARRRWLLASVAVGLSVLGFFKYFNFFAGEFARAAGLLGWTPGWVTLNIILPVGISFYTLQTMSYAIDVYYRRCPAERNLLTYATWVAFFPQLVAGPIERARNLLPQFNRVAGFSWASAYQGAALIIFGLFLKVVIADNLAPIVDQVYATWSVRNGGELLLGGIYFSAQIYADFGGYSTIAIGVAAIMGFRLVTNFETPYFATSISGFWQSWNISLTTFFRDYVYALIRKGKRTERRIATAQIVTFLISGLWHGANWTFVLWGFVHGVALVIERRVRAIMPAGSDWWRAPAGWAITMAVVVPTMIIFRSPSLEVAGGFLWKMVSDPALPTAFRTGLVYVALMFAVDWLWRRDVRLTDGIPLAIAPSRFQRPAEALLLAAMLHVILVNSVMRTDAAAFIYFQF